MAASPTFRPSAFKSHTQVELDDHYLIALAKQGKKDAYDRIVKRYYGFVRLKASSYFLIGGDADDLIQEGLVGLYKAVRDYRWDRESSFRNFAELCITRQIITAVKTSTRNKHTPLNEYVSFSQTPAAGGGDGDPTLDELLPGPTRARPGQPGDLLRGAPQPGRLPVERALRARELGAVALPGRAQLRGDRREARVRHEDGRQRAPAREAQGRRAPQLARSAALEHRRSRPMRTGRRWRPAPHPRCCSLPRSWRCSCRPRSARRSRSRQPRARPHGVHELVVRRTARSRCGRARADGWSRAPARAPSSAAGAS